VDNTDVLQKEKERERRRRKKKKNTSTTPNEFLRHGVLTIVV